MSDIIRRLLPGFFSDGNNTTFKYIEMSHYFSAYFANLVEAPDSFNIKYHIGNEYITLKVPSISHSIIDQYEKTQESDSSPAEPYTLEILPGNTALLTISSFWMGSENAYKKFLKNSFSGIRKKGIENLIIDVRNNEGGTDRRGALLLSWLMNNKFRYYDHLQAATRSKYSFAQYARLPKFYGIMRHLITKTDTGTYVWNHNRNLKMQKPKRNSFSGNVYILINGGSFSVTSEFASVAHYLKRAKFIGEETGGAYYGNNSGTFVIVTLPNSRLNVGIPMLAYYTAVKNYPFKDRGIIPDHEVNPAIEDILNKKDTVLSFTKELIEKQK
jgi:C-terminal processing protease CtpA/Prc